MAFAVAFFVHELVPFDFKTENLIVEFEELKEERNIARQDLLNSLGNTELNRRYLEKQKELADKYKIVIQAKEGKKFNGFISFKAFLGEFGWALGLMLYSLFNLYLAFFDKKTPYRNSKFVLHFVFIAVSAYFIAFACWPNLPRNLQGRIDFPKSVYWVMAISTSVLMFFAMRLFVTKQRSHLIYLEKKIDSLELKLIYVKKKFDFAKQNIRDLIDYVFENTRDEDEEKMLDLIETITADEE